MKANFFIPKYMLDFKCVGSECVDTCCAGWDINIDSNTFNKYTNSTGEFKELLEGKFIKNKHESDFFNNGFMVLKPENRCPFLDNNLLCDIHGNVGEDNLCITCKRYPRVFNIVDDVYEKSGLPSCYEICKKAFLNKEKMEFIEIDEDVNDDEIEIRRIIDTEAFEDTDSLLQYFWDIRVVSINIIQLREFNIERRLNILKGFYNKLEILHSSRDFDAIEDLLEDFNSNNIDYNLLKDTISFDENIEFNNSLFNDKLVDNIKSLRLKKCIDEYKLGIISISHKINYWVELENYSYIFENYLVNQIFKDLIPFNKGESFNESITILINSYKIIKAYTIGIALNNNTTTLTEDNILRVIQSLSKDIEHNKVFKGILENN